MLQFSFWLAIITFIAFAFLWMKLPKGLRRWLRRRSLVFDIVVSIGVYIFLGSTLMALLSAAMFGIMVSIYLFIVNLMEQPNEKTSS